MLNARFYIGFEVPCAPLAAIIAGFVLYVILAKAGLESQTLELTQAKGEPAKE